MSVHDSDLPNLIEVFSNEFDAICAERHNEGMEKYGPFKFLGADVIQEAIEEIADMANYARYQFIKLRMIQTALMADKRIMGLADENGDVTIGVESFKATGDTK